MSLIRSSEGADPAVQYRPACMTPGCSTNCSLGYSCHEQRLGRGPAIAWPVVALAGLILAMLII